MLLCCCLISLSCALSFTKDQVQVFCDGIEKTNSLLFPFRCVSDEERLAFGRRGEAFMKENKIRSIEPVILVPGVGGSALESKLVNANPPYSFCYKNTDWRRIWLNLAGLLPIENKCWYYDVKANYNMNNTWSNNPGVFIRPIDWGGVEGIDYMDRIFGHGISVTSYFSELIEDLKKVGYVPNVNLRGAPFDWRLADNPNNFFGRFKTLIEETYHSNNDKHVHLIVHSFGNIHVTSFLNRMSQGWKDKYIGSLISVAAPWSGSPKALRSVISGDNFGIEVTSWLPILDSATLRPILRELGSTSLLLPEVEFWTDEELVKTPTRSYTANELNQLFDDINAPITKQIFNYTDGIMANIRAPDVELHCLFGNNFPTEIHYTYNKGFDKNPHITYSEQGDGTVPISSLRMCTKFKDQQSQSVEVKEFDLSDHFTVLNDPELLEYILQIITQHDL